jgi:hypothetical protein
MRTLTTVTLLAAVACAGCKVKVKDGGELPRVDVAPGTMPDVEVSTDSVHMPDVKMPDVKMPDVKMPEVKAPDIHAPDVKLPEVKAPDVKLPDLDGDRDRAPARTDTTRRP